MKTAATLLCCLLLPAAAGAENGEPTLDRFMKTQSRISTACQSEPQGELCQAYLHGLLQGVQAMGAQTSKLAQDWAELYETGDRNQGYAWLTRDILYAASCSPDALDFVSRFSGNKGADARQAEAHVAQFCRPIWSQHDLLPEQSRRAVTLR